MSALEENLVEHIDATQKRGPQDRNLMLIEEGVGVS
jgi:hypothetical protein